MFSSYVSEQLKSYVYRLIDPRNGETFYVGRGVGNRVFSHIKEEVGADEDGLAAKLHRIRQIRLDGFDVAHVIHRHGLDDLQAAEVEAALIDAYPETANEVGGFGSSERGLMHARQIVEKYEAKNAEFLHKAVLITINRSATERESVYAAVRHAWKIAPNKAKSLKFVMAVRQGLIVGVFEPETWLDATTRNFPDLLLDRPGCIGFIGHEAPGDIQELYLRRRVPDAMRKRGAANPIRYVP